MKQLYDDVYNSYRSMILSASGWRKVFAADGDDNSMGTELTGADQLLSAAIGTVFASWAISRGCRTIAAGRDARPTGKAITEIIIRAAMEAGLRVQYLSVCAAPEIMAYVKQTADLDGFIYISASHNPAGHNGVKFGLGNGAVIGGQDSAEIISMFREFMENRENYPAIEKLSSTALEIPASEATKQEALDTYMNFNLTTAFPDSTLLEKFRRIRKPAVIADMNGSARTLSIDHQFFTTLGIEHAFINNKPGAIAHGILPEGKNLDWAASFLEKKFREDSSFTMGYMPDNDGDRGNLVFIDSHTGKAIIPDAQTVFALACAAELSFMEYSGMIVPGKTAVAVNCPTSLRIEEIAAAFGVQVFRAEVGEANVVDLAEELREKGYTVRFLGEGSNGGNITHPATVRDPLNTLMSIIRFMAIPELMEIWLRKRNISPASSEKYSFTEIIGTLPQFVTTATDDSMAKLHIQCTDHGLLKVCYEEIFLREWSARKSLLGKDFGIVAWEEINTIGTSAISGMGAECRAKGVKGGLKILFSDASGNKVGYLWMRGSGTEPIFRISSDIKGNDREKERYLITWQKKMTEEADITALRKLHRS